MATSWDPTATPATATCTRLTEGVNAHQTLHTRHSSASDPTTGWDSTDEGAIIIEKGWDAGSALSPRMVLWQQVTSGGTFGKRPLCLRYIKWLDTPQSITLPGSQPYTADQVFADVDLTTLLDGAGVQLWDDIPVDAVYVRVTVTDTGTLGTGSANEVYAEFRKKGATNSVKVRCIVSDVVNEAVFWQPLDSDEIFQFGATVANTSPSMTVTAEVLGFMELA